MTNGLFTAYFDASGHPDDVNAAPALFVSGFLSTADKWLRFEHDWLALLDEYGITPPFHMTDFESGSKQYTSWKGDRQRREAFRLAALRIIKRRTHKPLSAGVNIADFRRLFREYDMPADIPREPYAFCGHQAVMLLRPWMERRVSNSTLRRTDRFRIVFEQGDKHKGALQRALSSRGLPPAFESKAKVVAFQACDFLAWMHRNWLTTRTRRGRANYRPRQSLLEFTRMFPTDSSVFGTWDGFVRECEDQGIPKRT